MSKFFKSKLFITLIIITVISGILMAVSTMGLIGTNPVTNALGVVFSPVTGFFNYIGDSVGGFFGEIADYKEYKPKYNQAVAEMKLMEEKIRDYDNMKIENERLKKLLEIKNDDKYGTKIAATVTSVNPSNWYEDVIINKGAADGIKKDSTVINAEGLVGRISEVGETWSKVTTILDSTSSAGCIVPRNGDVAVVEGNVALADGGACSMNYITKDATLAVGDSVETSAQSSIYPAGILIGKVSSVMPDSQGFYNKATVKAAVDFRKLREVIVIVGEN